MLHVQHYLTAPCIAGYMCSINTLTAFVKHVHSDRHAAGNADPPIKDACNMISPWLGGVSPTLTSVWYMTPSRLYARAANTRLASPTYIRCVASTSNETSPFADDRADGIPRIQRPMHTKATCKSQAYEVVHCLLGQLKSAEVWHTPRS